MTSPAVASADARKCWVCGSEDTTPYKARSIERRLVPDDLKISDAHYGSTLALARCRRCGFLFADGSDLDELFQLYEALDDPGYEESQDSRTLQMNWLLDATLRAHPAAHSLLDVGAAAGLLVSLARARGLAAEGVEPSVKLVQAAAREHGVELHQGKLPHPALAGRRFDAVLLVDVIEHVSDPLAMLREAKALLADDGVMIVVTPDVSSLARKLLGKRWWHFRLAHVGYFDRGSFARACERVGLSVATQFRARWFFRASYLADRLARYLPIAGLTRLITSTTPGARAAQRVVPLDLHDSWVFVCRKSSGGG